MTEHVHIDFESDPIEAGDEFCRVCNPLPQYLTSGGGGGGAVLSATVILTDAQIKALPTTAVEIVPAPAADQCLLYLSALLSSVNVVAYTNVTGGASTGFLLRLLGNAGDLSIYAEGSVANVLLAGEGGLADPALVSLPPIADISAGYAVALSTYSPGLGIELKAYNTGDFTGGDAANSMTVTVLYAVVDV